MSGDPIGNLVNGALTGILTGDNDAVVVEMTGVADDNGLIINLNVNGVEQTFGTSQFGVNNIVLNGLGGDDQITVKQALAIDLDITGGLGNDTLIGPTDGVEWTIDGADSGSAIGITRFAGIENLVGGSGDDQFEVEPGGSISGQIDGGNGDDRCSAQIRSIAGACPAAMQAH